MENSFQEIKKKDEAEYIKRVQQILEKSKIEEKKELMNNKIIILNREKLKKADEQIKKISNDIKINEINSNLNTLFLSPSEVERGKNVYNKISFPFNNNILKNFNLVDFLNQKHKISQIKLSSSYIPKEKEKNNILNKKREFKDEDNEYNKKAKDMKDLTNNELIFSQLKNNYEGTKNKIVSESEEESDGSEEFKFGKNKKENKIQKKIREKEEKLKNFIRSNKESKYETERNYKFKGKKRKNK